LYYRLNVFPIGLPPLRDREGDVPLLVHCLVARFAARVGVRIESVGKATMERLSGYSWPGNIRELENVLERAVILSTARRWRLIRKSSPRPLWLALGTPVRQHRPVPKGQGRRQQALGRHRRSKAWSPARETTFWPLLKSPVGSLTGRAARRASWAFTPVRSAAE
jgi:transcriptional regulator with GAF, ATPase, and Fis domain